MKYLLLILIFSSLLLRLLAQAADGVSTLKDSSAIKNIGNFKNLAPPTLKNFIFPATLVAGGIVFSQIKKLTRPDVEIAQYEQQHFHSHTKIDNYLQYSPAAFTLGLDAFGVKGKHNFKEKIIIYALTTVFTTALAQSLKYSFHRIRPDSSASNAFPSGHTATAFAAAEFLNTEYGGRSIWYGIAGYSVAGATGLLRIYNNRHWLTDVIAGAGIGFISTRLSYLIYPEIKKLIFKKRNLCFIPTPYYDGYSGGIKMIVIK
jgi:membrane-associated phospholipid phosphatase